MGHRGPCPTPPEIAERKGKSHHKQRPPGPRPTAPLPPPPKWLESTAAKVYCRLVKELKNMRVGKRPDRNALIRYCRLWVRWKQADIFLQKYGETYPVKKLARTGKDENGEWQYRDVMERLKEFPQVKIVDRLSVLLLRLEQEFGLTPSSRARINVDVLEPKPDPMAELIQRIENRRGMSSN